MSEADYERPADSTPLVQPEGVNAASAAQIEEPAKPKGRHRADSKPPTAAPAIQTPTTPAPGVAAAANQAAGAPAAKEPAGEALAGAEPEAKSDELVGAPPNDPASGQDAGSME
jgi:hypothetical protein